MTMFVPFRRLGDLLIPSVVETVPKHLVYFACAMHHWLEYWMDEHKIRRDMELESHRVTRIDTFIARVRCLRELMRRCDTGELSKDDAEAEHAVAAALDPTYSDRTFRDAKGDLQRYNIQQRFLKAAVREYIDAALAAEWATSLKGMHGHAEDYEGGASDHRRIRTPWLGQDDRNRRHDQVRAATTWPNLVHVANGPTSSAHAHAPPTYRR
jgi:hypothetical protein